jgi:hypothetical protein
MSPTPSAATSTAGNFTIGTSTATSSDAAFSDKVALAALLLGGGAFVIAFLQMFYQYLTTNLRDKCSSGAIGGWQHFMRTGWDFTSWRPRIEYPLVDLNVWHVLEERYRAEVTLEKELGTFTSLITSGRYKWTQTSSTDDLGLLDVWHGTKIFTHSDDDTIVRFFKLPREAQYEWFTYLRKYPRRKLMVARASWSNMLSCLGVFPSKELILKKQRADVIPAGMDAPMQSTTLRSIGVWCFLLGMKDVEFYETKATIKAQNKYAAIGTLNQNLPGVANVISLEGDLDGLRRSVIRATTPELFGVITRAIGLIDFVAFRVAATNYQPLNIVDALHRGWSKARIWVIQTTPTNVGNLIWEANRIENPGIPETITVQHWVSLWQSWGVGACPSILQTLAFLPYQSICGCFPRSAYLSPYTRYVLDRSKYWWSEVGKNICEVDPQLYVNAAFGEIPFLRADTSFLVVSGEVPGYCGSRSWIFHSCHDKLREWDGHRFDNITKLCEPQNGEFISKFPILSLIDRLLGGDGLDMGSDASLDVFFMRIPPVTLESALWFTLFTLEGRIEALWDGILTATGEPIDVNSKKSSYTASIEPPLSDLLWVTPSDYVPLSSSLASFLALWLTICGKIDLFSEQRIVHDCFDEILEDWKDKDEICVSNLIEQDRRVLPARRQTDY